MRHRRPARRLVLVLLLVLAAPAAAGAVWLTRFEPLETADGVGFGYEPGFNFSDAAPQIGFRLLNDGRVGVRITQIDAPHGGVAFTVPDDMDPLQEEAHLPLEEFDLEPGETRWIVVAWSLSMCRDAEPSGAILVETVRVRFEVLKIPRWTTLHLDPETNRVIADEGGAECIARRAT